MNARTIAVLTVLLALAACSSTTEQRVPMPDQSTSTASEGMSRVYFFRTPGSLSPHAPMEITVGNTYIGAIEAGYYLCIELPPGLHQVRMELRRQMEKNLVGMDYGDVKPGRTYYGEIDFPISKSRRPNLTGLSAADGKARLANLKPAPVR